MALGKTTIPSAADQIFFEIPGNRQPSSGFMEGERSLTIDRQAVRRSRVELEIPMGAQIAARYADERDLVERAKTDRRAFAELYRCHQRAIGGYIYRRIGDSHATEDLVADVFTIALQALPRYRQRGLPVRAWLYRIATNRVNRWVRRERYRRFKRLEMDCEDVGGASVDAGLAREHTRAALLDLAPKFQAVLALHYLEGLPIREVATAIGCRVGTVKSRLARGRDALRQRLQPRRSSR